MNEFSRQPPMPGGAAKQRGEDARPDQHQQLSPSRYDQNVADDGASIAASAAPNL
jgi:hypothetical protein